ncbi:MAG: nitrous oxide reductase accessory protein NosL [Phycisphaerales bacterium]
MPPRVGVAAARARGGVSVAEVPTVKRILQASFLPGLLAIAACGRGAATGPPALRLGRDECGECGMAIHDERSSGALLIDRYGRRDYVLFDDIGCLLDAGRSEGAALQLVGAFVHDYSSNAWIPADNAVFVVTDGSSLRTPMGSGIAAFTDHAGAEGGRQQFGGEILDYRSLAAWRRERMTERHQVPGK